MFSHTKLFDYCLYNDFYVWKYAYMNICSYNHFWIWKEVFLEKRAFFHLKKRLVIPVGAQYALNGEHGGTFLRVVTRMDINSLSTPQRDDIHGTPWLWCKVWWINLRHLKRRLVIESVSEESPGKGTPKRRISFESLCKAYGKTKKAPA